MSVPEEPRDAEPDTDDTQDGGWSAPDAPRGARPVVGLLAGLAVILIALAVSVFGVLRTGQSAPPAMPTAVVAIAATATFAPESSNGIATSTDGCSKLRHRNKSRLRPYRQRRQPWRSRHNSANTSHSRSLKLQPSPGVMISSSTMRSCLCSRLARTRRWDGLCCLAGRCG